jgi:hypothetical protein
MNLYILTGVVLLLLTFAFRWITADQLAVACIVLGFAGAVAGIIWGIFTLGGAR